MTYRLIGALSAIAVAVVLGSTPVLAFTVADADGDGMFEVGEELTFAGDEGDLIPYDSWQWDTDCDGIFDLFSQSVVVSFDAEGEFNVVLKECSTLLSVCETQSLTISIAPDDGWPKGQGSQIRQPGPHNDGGNPQGARGENKGPGKPHM